MEYVWKFIAILSLGVGIYITLTDSFKKALVFYSFVIIAFAMSAFRKAIRKNQEKLN